MVVQDFSFCVTNQTGDCDCGVAVVRLGEDCGGEGGWLSLPPASGPHQQTPHSAVATPPTPHPAGDTRGYSRRWEGKAHGAG